MPDVEPLKVRVEVAVSPAENVCAAENVCDKPRTATVSVAVITGKLRVLSAAITPPAIEYWNEVDAPTIFKLLDWKVPTPVTYKLLVVVKPLMDALPTTVSVDVGFVVPIPTEAPTPVNEAPPVT